MSCLFFCSFLIVIATFLQLDVTHFIIPSKLFTGEPLTIKDFIFTYKYIPQVPAILFITGLLGRRLGITSILLYIITGLFFMPYLHWAAAGDIFLNSDSVILSGICLRLLLPVLSLSADIPIKIQPKLFLQEY